MTPRQPLPSEGEFRTDLTAATAAILSAQTARRKYRRSTKREYPQRVAALTKHIEQLRRHSAILRSHLKRSDYHSGPPYGPYARRTIKTLLRRLRYERAQLAKMLP